MYTFVAYKKICILVNMIALTSIIFLYHCGFLMNISLSVFLALTLAIFGFSLYKPSIAFALFVGVIPLEIVTIAPNVLDIIIRPYHVMGLALVVGGGVALLRHTTLSSFSFVWNIFDTLIVLLMSVAFVSAFFQYNAEEAVYYTIIFFSFGVWYFLTRFFVRSAQELIALMPILISSGVVISVYAIVQNVLYQTQGLHMEIMPGRPNATFTEPDWLGIYLVFVFATCITYMYYGVYYKHTWRFFNGALYFSLFTIVTALVITVARSAWIGACAVFLVYCIILLIQKKYKILWRHFVVCVVISVVSVIMIVLLHLTTFELDNRFASTHSGVQEITVACITETSRDALRARAQITDVEELTAYNCRHINLEDIDAEERAGHFVFVIDRDDPNVSVRALVYQKTMTAIQQQPFRGYGWNGSSKILGTDASGTPLNASNIFLETAVAIGLIGMSVLVMIFLLFGVYAVTVVRFAHKVEDISVGFFVLLGGIAIIMPNLFNAGLLLGFIWVFFGMSASIASIVYTTKA